MKAFNEKIILRNLAVDPSGGGKDLIAAIDTPVTVYQTGTTNLASLFDLDENPIANPINTDLKGNFAFKVANGFYDVIGAQGTQGETRWDQVQIVDFENSGEQVQDVIDNRAVISFETSDDMTAGTTIDGTPIIFSVGQSLQVLNDKTGKNGFYYVSLLESGFDLGGGLYARKASIGQSEREQGLRERIFRATGGIVSIQYDGAFTEATNTAWALHKERGLPADFAIDGDFINNSAVVRARLSSLLQIQKDGGRFSSHGLNVEALGAGTSEDTIKYEVEESKRVLSQMGFDIDGFVPSQGQFDQTHIKYVEQNYTWMAGEAAVYTTPGDAVFGDGDLFNIHRLNMGQITVQQAKDVIDYCINNDEWVVFYDHAPGASGPVPPSSATVANLTEILDYIVSSGIRCLTTSDAVSAQFKDASFGYKIKGIADNVALLNGSKGDSLNYLLDTDGASIGNAKSPWIVNDSVPGTTNRFNEQSKLEDRILYEFAGDGSGSGELSLTQDIIGCREFAFGSGFTFAIDFIGSNESSGVTVSLGIRVIDSSDSSILDQEEVEFEYKSNRARRMWVSLKNKAELNLQTSTIRVFIKLVVPDASNQFKGQVINPRLTKTATAVEYRPNRISNIVDRANTVSTSILPSGNWEQLDYSLARIGELEKVSSGRYSASTPGLYMLNASYAINNEPVVGIRIVNSSGSTLHEGRGDTGCAASTAIYLEAGDYFDVQARQTSGVDKTISIAYLSSIRLR